METKFNKTFTTKSFKRALSALYSNLDNRSFCLVSWRECVDGEIKTVKRVLRVWDAKSLFNGLTRYSFVSFSL